LNAASSKVGEPSEQVGVTLGGLGGITGGGSGVSGSVLGLTIVGVYAPLQKSTLT
jgi:hypothetical protein